MSAPPMSSESVEVDWPDSLRPFIFDGGVKLVSSGPHAYTWFAVPFAAVLLFAGVLGVTGLDGVATGVMPVLVGCASFAFGSAVGISVAYTAWGRLEIYRRDGEWIVTQRIGRWSRERVIATSQIYSADVYDPGPAALVFPGNAGPHIRVHRRRNDRPVEIGGGLLLTPEVLEGIKHVLTG
jgi:hypothetical protein